MRKVLTEKLRLDGVEFDEFVLKPNLRNMLTGDFAPCVNRWATNCRRCWRDGLVSPPKRARCAGDDAESDAPSTRCMGICWRAGSIAACSNRFCAPPVRMKTTPRARCRFSNRCHTRSGGTDLHPPGSSITAGKV